MNLIRSSCIPTSLWTDKHERARRSRHILTHESKSGAEKTEAECISQTRFLAAIRGHTHADGAHCKGDNDEGVATIQSHDDVSMDGERLPRVYFSTFIEQQQQQRNSHCPYPHFATRTEDQEQGPHRGRCLAGSRAHVPSKRALRAHEERINLRSNQFETVPSVW